MNISKELIVLAKDITSGNPKDVDQWQDAYSYYRGPAGSNYGIMEAIYDAGYTKEQAEAIFRHRHVRWFFDRYEEQFNKAVAVVSRPLARKLFSEYLGKHKKDIDQIVL